MTEYNKNVVGTDPMAIVLDSTSCGDPPCEIVPKDEPKEVLSKYAVVSAPPSFKGGVPITVTRCVPVTRKTAVLGGPGRLRVNVVNREHPIAEQALTQ